MSCQLEYQDLLAVAMENGPWLTHEQWEHARKTVQAARVPIAFTQRRSDAELARAVLAAWRLDMPAKS
jgi:hypothetical protein